MYSGHAYISCYSAHTVCQLRLLYNTLYLSHESTRIKGQSYENNKSLISILSFIHRGQYLSSEEFQSCSGIRLKAAQRPIINTYGQYVC